jgi:hypothetical protein
MHSTQGSASGRWPGCHAAVIAAAPKAWLIAGTVIGLAAFNAQLLAAREHMVRTDPGSLTAARIARTGDERQSAAVAAPAVGRRMARSQGGDAAAASPQAQQAGQRAMFGIVGGRPGLRRLLVSYFLAAKDLQLRGSLALVTAGAARYAGP